MGDRARLRHGHHHHRAQREPRRPAAHRLARGRSRPSVGMVHRGAARDRAHADAALPRPGAAARAAGAALGASARRDRPRAVRRRLIRRTDPRRTRRAPRRPPPPTRPRGGSRWRSSSAPPTMRCSSTSRAMPLEPDAELVLLHVAESAASRYLGPETSDQEARQDQATLEALAAEFQARGVSASVRLGFGDVKAELARMVEESGADLLVVGSHGHRMLQDLFHGATTSDLRHRVRRRCSSCRPGTARNHPSPRVAIHASSALEWRSPARIDSGRAIRGRHERAATPWPTGRIDHRRARCRHRSDSAFRDGRDSRPRQRRASGRVARDPAPAARGGHPRAAASRRAAPAARRARPADRGGLFNERNELMLCSEFNEEFEGFPGRISTDHQNFTDGTPLRLEEVDARRGLPARAR